MVKKPKVKPKPKPEPETKQPKSTLKQKIDKTVDDWKDSSDELKKQLFSLVQRVLYPDQFCPECDERLFFSPTGWSCPNCGYQRQQGGTPQAPTTSPATNIPRPSQGGKVPPQVEKVIQQSQENMKNPRRVNAPNTKGAQIRKLVDQMDSGGASAPTPGDEAKVRGDKNVGGKINWL